MSDGNQPSTRVAELSKVRCDFKVRGLWKEWRRKGLGDMIGVKGGERFKRSFDPEDFGIEIPDIPVPAQASPPEPDPGAKEQNTLA